ncbi:MAG: 16S rRNA (cytosine(967)-C(5))-methyltransferase RsmB [Pyrinomonadaceae bacterium]
MSARAVSKSRKKQKMRNVGAISPARVAAFETLKRVEEEGAFASVLLAATGEELSSQDRALSYELVLGVLRWQRWLDCLIEHFAGRSAQSLDAPVRQALRLGLYQLRFLTRVPSSAVVNDAVNLVHAARLRSAAAFVNAVLRRATREPDYDPASNITDTLERIAVKTSHPTWLIERWVDAFGFEETERFARSNTAAPPVAFRVVKDDETDVIGELRAGGATLSQSTVAPDGWRVEGASAVWRRLSREGKIYVQDEASQLLAYVLDAQSGEMILDACAAPGSKTTHIAALTKGEAKIVAGDLYEHRLRTVLESAARQRLKGINVVALNATVAMPFAEGCFDRVLVDAPCTGTGTLRRNPEIRWRITPSDIADLSRRQRLILANASKMVRPGGRLVYSTCSVEKEENEEVVEDFLAQHKEFKQVRLSARAELQTDSGALRTWPHRQGTDGFFIAACERQSS